MKRFKFILEWMLFSAGCVSVPIITLFVFMPVVVAPLLPDTLFRWRFCEYDISIRLYNISKHDFLIEGMSVCQPFLVAVWDDSVRASVARFGQSPSAVLLHYMPSDARDIPRIVSTGPKSVRISLKDVKVLSYLTRYDDLSIEYDVGGVVLPEPDIF